MMNTHIKTIHYTVDQIDTVAHYLDTYRSTSSIFTFEGMLGAGKTTLVKAFLKQVGVQEQVTSPTFTYVQIYTDGKGHTFYHFDLYRVATIEQFQMLGFDEYLYQPRSWALIEWPGVIRPLLTHGVCDVSVEYCHEPLQRTIRIQQTQ